MITSSSSPSAVAAQLGARLKQARLNANKTQAELADKAGLNRKAVLNAEKGKAQLETVVAMMIALNLSQQLDSFLPPIEISPLQLAKLQGKKRQRASKPRNTEATAISEPEKDEW
ncbi:MAG: transcriptional regulator [Cellvibrionaceae bacterium]|nr:transcriptional regulator [Cellvibrionaceae bacterium]|tara:strand:- start:8145 stop:8489 length:345 start_codon:yes stop_codon:yes gene_type:complete